MTLNSDNVSKIQKRYSLTLINPSSFYTSFVYSLIIVSVIAAATVFAYLQSDDFIFRILGVLAVLIVTQFVDSKFIRNKEYSKALHMSLFGNSLWLLTIFSGMLSVLVLSKTELSLFYIAEGMFLFASFRIGIYTTTLGASIRKAWLVCFIQPLSMFLVLIPIDLWESTLLDPMTLGVGAAFLIISTAWSVWTDRAGRPGVKSTHQLVQAYLFSLSKKDPSEVESLIAERSKDSTISTQQIRFVNKENNNDFRFVIPEIHPGPFHPIGGNNLPYLIYKNLNSSAMVLHSPSDHALNLPTQKEVDIYLQSLTKGRVQNQGVTCTEPVTINVNKARSVGLLFEKTAILFLSLSPHGMEDIPVSIKTEIEQFSKNRKFDDIIIVDCHNAMGEDVNQIDSQDLLTAAKSTLDTLMTKPTYSLEFGYANSSEMNLNSSELAPGGIGILCMRINNKKYFLGWADANNMENGVRESVVEQFEKNGYTLLEICTSDTHYTTKDVRNKNGYNQFGKITQPDEVSRWYLDLAKNAESKISSASFEILHHKTDVKIMGPTIYRDFSKAIDNSMKITKAVLIGCAVLFLVTML